MISIFSSIYSRFKENWVAYAFMAPLVIFLLIFGAYPVLNVIVLSFFKLDLYESFQRVFHGLAGYRKILFQDPHFWRVLSNTAIYSFGSTILQVFVGFLAAWLLSKKIKGRAIFRGIMLIPWVTPIIVVGIAWRWMLNPSVGMLNFYLSKIGIINNYIAWLGNETTIWPVLLIISTWKGYPYMALMMLAGIQDVPESLLESASMDGANALQKIRYVVLPIIKPILLITALTATLLTWNNFRFIYAMTKGGPGYSTTTISIYIQSRSFQDFKLGEGAVIATLSFLVLLAFTVVYIRRGGLEAQ